MNSILSAIRHPAVGIVGLGLICLVLGSGAGWLAGRITGTLRPVLELRVAARRRWIWVCGALAGMVVGMIGGWAIAVLLGLGPAYYAPVLLAVGGLTAGSFLGGHAGEEPPRREGGWWDRAQDFVWFHGGVELEAVLGAALGALVGLAGGLVFGVALHAMNATVLSGAVVVALAAAGGVALGLLGGTLGHPRRTPPRALAGMVVGALLGAGTGALVAAVERAASPALAGSLCGALAGACFGLIGGEWGRDSSADWHEFRAAQKNTTKRR